MKVVSAFRSWRVDEIQVWGLRSHDGASLAGAHQSPVNKVRFEDRV